MVRGCFIYDKKYSNFDLRDNTINYIKLIKPTEPIVRINYKNVNKFYPLIRKHFLSEIPNNNDNNINYALNNKLNNKKNLRKNNTDKRFSNLSNNFSLPYKNNNDNDNNNNNYNREIIKKKNKIPMPKNNFQIDDNNESNVNNYYNNIEKENNINYNNKIDKDGLSLQFKKKIYDWLIDIGIIKDKIIKIEFLPTLCINGVLLCDLVNRCEGKNEILKGIIRKTSTRSHIQVNVNKVLEYLRSLEKFPSRHLWNNIEISKGNSLVIWELLDDIYNYYGNKIKFKRIKKKNNKNNLNKTFTQEKRLNNNNLDKNEDFKFDNFYSNTPLKHRKLVSLNINNNNIKNNNYGELNDKNDYFKYSHTPIINKKIESNENNTFNNNYYNNKTFEINKNNFNKKIFNIKDNKKANKKDKYKYNINNIDFNYKATDSSYRNNLNHTNDNIYESRMFTADNINDNTNLRISKIKKNNMDNTYRKNLDISSFYSDKFFNIEKSNKSFSVNNGFYNKRKNKNSLNKGNNSRFNININNQSFYSTNAENKMRNKGCFLLFEKSTINKLKEKMGTLNKYNTIDLETLDIKDI